MRVVYSQQVRDAIKEYQGILVSKYKITKQRALIKTRNLRRFLQSIGQTYSTLPICDKKDLGQIFHDGEPINGNLRMCNYSDESGYVWRFSVITLSTKIEIYRMLGSDNVKETIAHNNELLTEIDNWMSILR